MAKHNNDEWDDEYNEYPDLSDEPETTEEFLDALTEHLTEDWADDTPPVYQELVDAGQDIENTPTRKTVSYTRNGNGQLTANT